MKRARQIVVDLDVEGQTLRFRQMGWNVRPMLSHSVANPISSTSTVTVPDSIFDKSRMSLISVRRSGAGGMDVPGEIDLPRRQVAADVLGQLLTEDQNRVERRPQLVRHVRQELGLVLRGQRQLRRLLLERAASLLHFLVLALDFDVLLGELFGFRRQFLVGALQLGLPRLQLDGELLRLLQQILGPHRRLDRVQDDADRLRELFEEGQVRRRVNGSIEDISMTALVSPSKSTGSTTMFLGLTAPRLEVTRE